MNLIKKINFPRSTTSHAWRISAVYKHTLQGTKIAESIIFCGILAQILHQRKFFNDHWCMKMFFVYRNLFSILADRRASWLSWNVHLLLAANENRSWLSITFYERIHTLIRRWRGFLLYCRGAEPNVVHQNIFKFK